MSHMNTYSIPTKITSDFIGYLAYRFFIFFCSYRNEKGDSLLEYLKEEKELKEVCENFKFNEQACRKLFNALVTCDILSFDRQKFYTTSFSTPKIETSDQRKELFNRFENDPFKYNNIDIKEFFITTLSSNISHDMILKNFHEAYFSIVISKFFQLESMAWTLKNNTAATEIALNLSTNQIFDHYLTNQNLLGYYALGFYSMNYENDKWLSSVLFTNPLKNILELGCGIGGLSAHLNNAWNSKESTFYLYDHPHSAALLHFFRKELMIIKDNVIEVSGDFFLEPEDLYFHGIADNMQFDMIIMGWVIHDWNDEKSSIILNKAHHHLKEHGKLVLLEKEYQEDPINSIVDFLMLVMAEGQERTLDEYISLCEKSNFKFCENTISTKGRNALIFSKK